MDTKTITITFCDKAENHVGMQQLGTLAENGFSLDDLFIAKNWFENKGTITELFDLTYPLGHMGDLPDNKAYILIIRGGANIILDKNKSIDLFNELVGLEWDTKALMYGRIVNKHARYNLCFANQDQEPDYANKKGRIVSFESVPLLLKIKNTFYKILGQTGKDLVAEGNYYYDISHCGIGYHGDLGLGYNDVVSQSQVNPARGDLGEFTGTGKFIQVSPARGDSERKKVIGVRLGASIPLVYQWYHNGNSFGQKIKFSLNDGDIYFMSEKATGNDWKKRSIYTLRHAAGSTKYTN